MVISHFLSLGTYFIQAVGYSCMFLTGNGWLWGEKIESGDDLKALFLSNRMDGFYVGLAVCPILMAVLLSALLNNWFIVVVTFLLILIPLLIQHFFDRNLFIPVISGLILFISIITACLLRLSVVLVLFFLYFGVLILGAVLLALFFGAL